MLASGAHSTKGSRSQKSPPLTLSIGGALRGSADSGGDDRVYIGVI